VNGNEEAKKRGSKDWNKIAEKSSNHPDRSRKEKLSEYSEIRDGMGGKCIKRSPPRTPLPPRPGPPR
jgi:hypothetical protein